MGIINEPDGVDLYVVNKPMSEKDKKEVSKIIAEYKEKAAKKRKPEKKAVSPKKAGAARITSGKQ